MAGYKINENGSSSITLTNLISILDASRIGYDAISLTNYSTQALPAIAAGSRCEIGGSLYGFSTEEAISTTNIVSTESFTYFVELVPSSSIVTAQFSSVVPAWREDYQGWYESTLLNYRVVAEMEFDGVSTLYWYKRELKYLDRKRLKTIYSTLYSTGIGGSTSVDHYLTNPLNRVKECVVVFNEGGALPVQTNRDSYVASIWINSTYVTIYRSTSVLEFYMNIAIKYI